MQEVSSVRFVSKKLRNSALKAWHLLLEQKDLHAPAISAVTSIERQYSSSLTNDTRKAARLMVDLYSRDNDFTPAWLADSSFTSTQGMRSSHVDLADVFEKQDIACMLEKLETDDDHAEYMSTVGADLLLDPFHLTTITDSRPLFTATMMSLKQHSLIEDLRLDRDAVAGFLMKVEDG